MVGSDSGPLSPWERVGARGRTMNVGPYMRGTATTRRGSGPRSFATHASPASPHPAAMNAATLPGEEGRLILPAHRAGDVLLIQVAEALVGIGTQARQRGCPC